MMKEKDDKKDVDGLKRNEEKWGKELLDAGWVMLPSTIVERQRALGLDAMDINILLHLIRHWWYADRLPFPSKRAIADCMNINESTVRKRIKKLEAGGLVKRIERYHPSLGRDTNAYDLSGLIEEATPFAVEAVEQRKHEKKARAARRTRKRPLTIADVA
jgi:DNA-binding transcriptional regulator YhcF (GntR family)